MGCCGKKSEDDKGLIENSKRGCRDVLCCILFILFWGGMIGVAAISIKNGDVYRLIYGTDYRGQTCGQGDLIARKRIVYPRLTQDLLMNMDGFVPKSNPLEFKFYGICVEQCPQGRTVLCNDEDLGTEATAMTTAQKNECFKGSFTFAKSAACQKVVNNCWQIPMNMSSVFWRCLPDFVVNKTTTVRCTFPSNITDPEDPACAAKEETVVTTKEEPAQENLLYDKLNQARSLWTKWIGDLQRSWWVIALAGIGIALVLSFIWILFLKSCTGLMVCLTILLCVVAMFALTFFCYAKAGILDAEVAQNLLDKAGSTGGTVSQQLEASETNKSKFKYAAYVFSFLTLVLLLVLIGIRKSIIIAVKSIKEASKALMHHPLLVLYPLNTVVALLALLAYWIWIAALMFSAGEVMDVTDIEDTVAANIQVYSEKYADYNTSVNINATLAQNSAMKFVQALSVTRYLFAYHFFGLLWTNQVIQGIGIVTIAGCVAEFYFHKNSADEYWGKRSSWRVGANFWRTLRYHLGSICFAGFLVALLQFIRAVFEYLRSKMEENKSKTVKYIAACVSCCLWCIQKCVQFVSKNALIYVAVKGSSFCTAAVQAVSLIVEHLADMVMVNAISSVLLLMGKCFVTVVAGFATFYVTDNMATFQAGGDNELTSQWLGVLVTMIFAFAVASGFFYVYDIAIDTVVLCYCIDSRENQGDTQLGATTMAAGEKKKMDMERLVNEDEKEVELADRA